MQVDQVEVPPVKEGHLPSNPTPSTIKFNERPPPVSEPPQPPWNPIGFVDGEDGEKEEGYRVSIWTRTQIGGRNRESALVFRQFWRVHA